MIPKSDEKLRTIVYIDTETYVWIAAEFFLGDEKPRPRFLFGARIHRPQEDISSTWRASSTFPSINSLQATCRAATFLSFARPRTRRLLQKINTGALSGASRSIHVLEMRGSARPRHSIQTGGFLGSSPLCYKSRMPSILERFHPVVRTWFERRFDAPSRAQELGWPVIADANREPSHDVLLCAPTGSGKTLAAFMWAINRLVVEAEQGALQDEVSVLYVSPLKALANDIRLNLEEPLEGAARSRARPGSKSRISAPGFAPEIRPPTSAARCCVVRRTSSSPRRSRCSSC